VIGSANAGDFRRNVGAARNGSAFRFVLGLNAFGFNQGLDALLQAVTAFSRAAEEARTEFAAAAKRRTDQNLRDDKPPRWVPVAGRAGLCPEGRGARAP
jgi:hypothetical protein